MSTLLERWDSDPWKGPIPANEIRRALAIAQAVQWYDTYDPQAVEAIMRRAEELLEGKK